MTEKTPGQRPFDGCARRCLVPGHRERVSRDIVNDRLPWSGMFRDIVNGEQIRSLDQSRDHPGALLRGGCQTSRGIKVTYPQAASPLVGRR